MEISDRPGPGGQVLAAEAERTVTAASERAVAAGISASERAVAAGISASERAVAAGISAGVERLIGLVRSLSPADGLSLTAAATLADLERSGPQRLTALAVREGVTQPAMTQLTGRLQEGGLVRREADPGDGRVVQVRLTDQGRDTLARRRAVRAERLAVILDRISPADRAALTAALPAIDALASAQRDAVPTA
jgi:DNA-binding MarR family transcriptional regulator